MGDLIAGPYAPPENVTRILSRVRQSGIRKLDTAYLGQLGMNEAMAPRSLRALQFLGFIDKTGAPLQTLADYYAATSDEAACELFAAAIRSSYEVIFRAVNPASDGREKIEQAFRVMAPPGQRNRMVTLFLGLCRQAGLPVLEPPSDRPATKVVNRISRSKPVEKGVPISEPRAANTSIHEPVRPQPSSNNLLEKLLDKFPEFDPAWSDDLKSSWFSGFGKLQDELQK